MADTVKYPRDINLPIPFLTNRSKCFHLSYYSLKMILKKFCIKFKSFSIIILILCFPQVKLKASQVIRIVSVLIIEESKYIYFYSFISVFISNRILSAIWRNNWLSHCKWDVTIICLFARHFKRQNRGRSEQMDNSDG